MNKAYIQIGDARRRIDSLTRITRCLWCVNIAVMVIAILNRNYEMAALATFTWISFLLAAAMCRRVDKKLVTAEQTLNSQNREGISNRRAA